MNLPHLLIYIIMINFLFTSKVFPRGGDLVGNGGNAVVCRGSNDQILSVELLDYYEARVDRKFKLDRESHNLNQSINIFFDRLEKYDNHVSELLNNYYDDFFDQTNFLSDITMVNINDSHHIIFPSGCAVEQIAIQRQPNISRNKIYTINKDLWDHMDGFNQAGLIFHEILYKNQLDKSIHPINDSRLIRYFNALIAANKLENLNLDNNHKNAIYEKLRLSKDIKINKKTFKDFFIGKSFIRNFTDRLGVPTELKVEFKEKSLNYYYTCRFSKISNQNDVTVKLNTKINISPNSISFLKGAVKKEYTNDRSRFCTAVIQKNEVSYAIISDTQFVLGEDIWNLFGSSEEDEQDEDDQDEDIQDPVDGSDILIGKKWGLEINSSNGISMSLIMDFSTPNTMVFDVTCKYLGNEINVSSSAPVEFTNEKIINRIAGEYVRKEEYGFFCISTIPVRTMTYKVISPTKISISNDPLVSGENIWKQIP